MKVTSTIGQENLKYSYRSRNLPHRYDIDKPIFITFRLKFTLPQSVVEELNIRKKDWYVKCQNLPSSEKQNMLKTKNATFFNWFDEFLAKSTEIPQLLHRADLTKIIAQCLHYFNNQHYQLLSFCIMPNHVHVLILPITQPNGDIINPAHINYTWKKFSATQINKILDRKGSLWQQESYDHLVNSDNEFYNILEYIIDNPVKAGLIQNWEEWKGTWIKEDLKPDFVK
jgi:putative transposase